MAPNVQLNEGCGTQCSGSPEITPFHKAYSMSASKVMVGQCCCHLLLASASTKFGTPLRFFRIPLQRRMQISLGLQPAHTSDDHAFRIQVSFEVFVHIYMAPLRILNDL